MIDKRALRNIYREHCRKENRPEFLRVARTEIHSDFWHIFDEEHEDYTKRFGFFRGGRGGGRSTNISKALIHCALDDTIRVVAGRSFQNSIVESCKNDIIEQIDLLGVSDLFDVKRRDGNITCLATGSTFIFRGFERADKSIKSLSSVNILWWEEADGAFSSMLDKVEPTIRGDNSRLFFSWNPTTKDSPIERFREMNLDHSLGAIERTTHYHQNPWCPSSLKASAELLKSKDMEKYLHVYEGYYYQSSERSIFGKLIKKRMFEVDGSFRGCFIGVDWGFSNDPTCVVEAWIKERDLYIRRSASKVNLKLTDTPSWLLKHVPLIATYTSRADSARPETIDICRNKINLMKPAKKQSGSVESGINYIQSFDNIFIHPDCQQDTAIELASYSWKLDKYEEITRIPEDKNNHYADALRYALEPELKQKTTFAVA